MKAERWAQVDRLLDEALALPPEARADFLAGAASGDEELRREVASLLAAHDRAAGDFMQAPALEVAAQQLADERNRSLVGQALGPYQILAVLGVGGMGEVYLAQDGRLKRRLALKLLPRPFVADAARVERFAREARAASALNHPNIVTVYDIGEANGAHYIAMEYVEGQTLRERCQAGPFNAKEAVEIVIQIAAALSAAHEAGIVHRDIKPENVMLRRDGYVKVLDFGLVKLTERRSLGETKASDDNLAKTNPGAVLGTVSYMSPEQALGHEVDSRSDIFSLGVLLYEMLTRAAPFKGDRVAATLDAIVYHQPIALSEIRPDLPPEISRIVNRMLEKDRELRYQTAGDLRAVLKRLQRELEATPSASVHSGASPVVPRRFGKRWQWVAGASVLLAVGLAASWVWRSKDERAAAPPWSRAQMTQLTEHPDLEGSPNLTPDGANVIYSRQVNGQWDIFRQRVGGHNPLNLTSTSPVDDTAPALSHDGNFIAFRSERGGGGIYTMGATGENPRRVCQGFDPAWSPDDKEIVYSTRRTLSPNHQLNADGHLEIINLESGVTRRLAGSDNGLQPRWSPHGERIAYWAIKQGARRDIWTLPAAGGEPLAIVSDKFVDWNPVWSPDGKLLYFGSDRGGRMSLWRVALDERTGVRLGEPELVPTESPFSVAPSFSADGRKLVFVQSIVKENIQRVAFDPDKERATGQPVFITQSTRRPANHDIAPDGERLVYYSFSVPQMDIYVMKADGSEAPRQLTDDTYRDRQPRWSPDGQWIAFFSDLSGRYDIWLIRPDGSDKRQLTFTTDDGVVDPVWSPDGTRLAYSGRYGGSFIMELNKGWREQTPVALPPLADGSFVAEAWSPDGQFIAGVNLTQDNVAPGLIRYVLATQKYERFTEIGDEIGCWLEDSRRLLFAHKSEIYLADTQARKWRKVFTLPSHRLQDARLSPDQRMLYFIARTDESDLWLLSLPANDR